MFNQMKHAQIGVHFWTQHEDENCVRGAGDTLSVLLSPGPVLDSRVQFSSVRFASIQSALSADLINIKCVSNVKLFCRPQAQTTTAARWAGRPVGWLVTGVNNNRLQSVALMCLFLCMTNFFLQFSNTLNAVVSFTAPDINSNSNKYNNSSSHNSNNCSCIACISLRIRNIILCVMRVNFQSLPQPNNNSNNNNSILSMLHTDSLNCWLHCHRCSSVSICFM